MARTTIHANPAGVLELQRHIQKIHDSVVEDVRRDAWMNAAFDTGEMRSTIDSVKVRPLLLVVANARLHQLMSAVSRVVVGSDHWMFVEYPTQPHEIRARPGGALFWPGALHPVLSVQHPGTQAQPFMRPALYKQRTLRGRP